MLKYACNLPSPCSPKWKINEADWGYFEKFACTYKNVDDFPSPVHAHDHFSNIILDSAGKSIPKIAGLHRPPVVPWWNKDCQGFVSKDILGLPVKLIGLPMLEPVRSKNEHSKKPIDYLGGISSQISLLKLLLVMYGRKLENFRGSLFWPQCLS